VIQISASFTAEPIQFPLRRWLDLAGLNEEIQFSGYNQVLQQALDPSSESARIASGFNVFLIRLEDLTAGPDFTALAGHLATAIASLASRSNARQIVIFCPHPDRLTDTARHEEQLASQWRSLSNVETITAEEWLSLYPVNDPFDPEADRAGKIPFTGPLFAALATLIARRISARMRPPVKVLVLDADNTLWGGVCGEDSPAALEMEGAFRAVRECALAKRNEGMLLCLASKNQPADVDLVFTKRAACLGLTRDHFAGWKVSWKPKSQSLKELAEELNLGLESFLFLDDNPAEVGEVRSNCPEVLAFALPAEPSEIPGFLRHLWPLDTSGFTAEDASRTEFYRHEAERREFRLSAPSYADFLRDLHLQVEIAEASLDEVPRIAQLTKRTNQFNAHAVRLSEGELSNRMQQGAVCLSVRAADRFGDYGLVGAMLYQASAVPSDFPVQIFLLSCRALGKGVERAMIIELGRRACAHGAETIAIAFTETDRNEPCRRFLEGIGALHISDPAYCLPATVAANLAPISDHGELAPQLDSEPTRVKTPTPIFDGPLALRIATELHDPERVYAELCAIKRPRPELSQAFVKPGDATQEALAAIWREILGLEEVGLDDPFAALGGTSIQLVRLHAAIRRQFGTSIELAELFELPTIETQSARITGGTPRVAIETAPIAPASLDGDDQAVAIIGLALRVPGASDPSSFWTNLTNGVESISRLTREELDRPEDYDQPGYIPAKGIIEGVDLFDAAFFGILPKDARIMDPQQRIFLELAWEAMERAGYTPETHRQRIGVYGGAYFDTYLLANLCTDRTFLADLIPSIQVGSLQTELGNDKDYLATRVAYKMNLRGPAMTLQTACSTSMVAVIEACRAIRSGLCDMALAGGVTLTLPLKRGYFYTGEGMLSSDGHCRAFDENASGTVFGNGAGVVMLKRLSDAIRDRDHIHAVIRGTGLNNDGGVKHSYTAPSVEGQVDVIRMAHRDAGITADSIGYIEAHGTGTPLGDPIEMTALTKAFRSGGVTDTGTCVIGSLKTNIGHLDVASGVCGLIKTALSLEHGQLPPLVHFQKPNPKIDFAGSPFRVNTELTPWTTGLNGHPRRAGVSSFGVGGTNAHVVMEEAPALASKPSRRPNQLFLLSARTPEALAAAAANLSGFAPSPGQVEPADAAWTLAIGRKAFRCRRAVVAPNFTALAAALGSGAGISAVSERSNPGLHFLFPGQGAQHINMGRVFYESEPVFRGIVDECSEVLRPYLGQQLTDIIYPTEGSDLEAAANRLKHTVLAQPAIFVVEYALARLLRHWGIEPAAMIGHSVGEFVAACLAGVFNLPDALRLLAVRGQLMGELPGGGMLSVRLPEAELLTRLPDSLDLAAVNGPSLCVVAGPREELEAFRGTLEASGVVAQTLHTSHAFHSRMMDPVVERFAAAFSGIELRAPSLPILSTVTGEWLTGKETTNPLYWAKHLREPVRFHRTMVSVAAEKPEQVFVEVGPGQTLSSLVRQSVDRKAGHVAVSACLHVKETGCDHAHLLETVGRLWTCGVEIDWTAFYEGEERRRVILPTYPFERKRHWVEATPIHDNASPIAPTHLTQSPAPIQPVMSHTEPSPRREALADAIRAVLTDLSGIPAEELAGDASFLEQGFDSLLLTQVSKALQGEFKTEITLRELMGPLSSIDAMVAHLEATLPKEAYRPSIPSVVVPAPVAAPSPPPVLLPTLTAPVQGSVIEGVIAQQLELMRQQIALLQGGALSHPLPAAPPASPAPVAPKREIHPKSTSADVSAPTTAINRNLDDSLTERQRKHLDSLIEKYIAKTRTSKELTAKYRQWYADPRTVSGFNRRWKEMIYQIAVTKSKGSRLVDVDGNEYIDLLNGFGPNFLGHSPDFVTKALHAQLDRGVEVGPQNVTAMEAAQLFCEITGNERASFVNTGSEAVQAAMRLARTVTGRDKIVVFTKDYHGNFDEVLVKGVGAGDQLRSLPIAPGIPRRAVEDVIVLPYGTEESLEVIRSRAHELAAVIVEPIQSRRPEFQPREFIRELREITWQSGTVFVFDEVITGFRTGPRGAQEFYGVDADIATYGKVVGGGMPLGVVAGKAEFMDTFDGGMWNYGDDSFPEKGVTFFAGTFVRHPLAMTAVKEVLLHLRGKGPEFWQTVGDRATRLAQSVDRMFVENGAPFRMPNFGSQMFVRAAEDHKYANLLFFHMRHKGVFLLEGFPTYMTAAHTEADVDYVIAAFTESVAELQQGGFIEPPKDRLPIHLNGSRMVAPMSQISNSVPPPPLEAVIDEPSLYPMTEPQAEVWLASHLGGNASLCFNEINVLTMCGALCEEHLLSALQDLVNRHDSLRTVYLANGDGFEVRPHLPLDLPVIDLSPIAPGQQELEIEATLDRERTEPFDLANGPLFRTKLIRCQAGEHLLLLNAHHLACDGWSYNVLLRELGEFYKARVEGRELQGSPALKFSDHAVRAAALEESGAQEAFWLAQFAEDVSPLRLPVDVPAQAETDFRCGSIAFRLSPDELSALKRTAAKSGATVFALLLCVYQLLLHRISRQQRFVVWFPSAGQSGTGNEELVGHCVHVLPLIASIDPVVSFSTFLQSTQSRLLDALEHKDYTYGKLLKKLTADRRPPMEAAFNFERMEDTVEMNGLQTAIREVERCFATHPLFLKTCETPSGLEIRFDFQTSFFAKETVSEWLETYQAMLEATHTLGSAPVAESLATLSEGQSARLRTWNETGAEYPREASLTDLFRETAHNQGSAIALSSAVGRITYAKLDELSGRVARALVDAGATSDDRVGLFLERSPDLFVTILGVLKAGAAYVPIDPAYPAERARYIIEDSGISIVVSEKEFFPRLPKEAILLSARDALRGGSVEKAPKPPRNTPESAACVLYTSGSTGVPKGAIIPHRAIVRLVQNTNYTRFGEDEVILQNASICFDASLCEIFGALINGGTLVIPPPGHLSMDQIVKAIQDNGVTQAFLTTALFEVMVDGAIEAFATIRRVLTGGDIASPGHIGRLLEAYPDCAVVNSYGPTENTTFTSFHVVSPDDLEGPSIPIGRPIHNTTVWIVDPAGNPVPPGVPGELLTGGDGLALGYLNRPELTAERFVPDSFSKTPGARLYRTGDLCRFRHNGVIEFLGRLDHQIKIRGYRIEPGEVETQLGRHPGVRQCKVVVRGEGSADKFLAAYASPVPNAAPTREELGDYLRSKLPHFMVPSVYVLMRELPLNPNGKIDTHALPMPASPSQLHEDDLPLTATEASLTSLWKQVLGRGAVGLDDDFFALGGHSLLGMRLFAGIRRNFGVGLPLGKLFRAPTVRQLARLIDSESGLVPVHAHPRWEESPPASRPRSSALVAIQPKGDDLPLFAVHGGGGGILFYGRLSERLGTNLPFYAFEAPGLTRVEPVVAHSIEQTAIEYLAELRKVQPHGPFHLCGYSFGGIVAYEMACRLIAQGEEIDFLGLIDTDNPAIPARRRSLGERVSLTWNDQRNANMLDKIGALGKRVGTGLVDRLFNETEEALARTLPSAERISRFRQVQLRKAHERAMELYVPPEFAGKLTLFRASLKEDKYELSTDYGWSHLVGELEIINIPGNHRTLFHDDNVPAIAAAFRDALATVKA